LAGASMTESGNLEFHHGCSLPEVTVAWQTRGDCSCAGVNTVETRFPRNAKQNSHARCGS
jgi:hypothetical protein